MVRLAAVSCTNTFRDKGQLPTTQPMSSPPYHSPSVCVIELFMSIVSIAFDDNYDLCFGCCHLRSVALGLALMCRTGTRLCLRLECTHTCLQLDSTLCHYCVQVSLPPFSLSPFTLSLFMFLVSITILSTNVSSSQTYTHTGKHVWESITNFVASVVVSFSFACPFLVCPECVCVCVSSIDQSILHLLFFSSCGEH